MSKIKRDMRFYKKDKVHIFKLKYHRYDILSIGVIKAFMNYFKVYFKYLEIYSLKPINEDASMEN